MTTVPSPSSTSAAPRLAALDALRGVAALAVAWHHFYVIVLHGFPEEGPLRAHAAVKGFVGGGRWGVLGVPVFFVLSGFCVGQTWLRSSSWHDFAQRRARRIFPGYFASLGLVGLCAVAAKLASGTNDVAAFPTPTITHIIATLSLMTSPASAVPTISWVYWSLTYEVAFYLILACVLTLPLRTRLAVLAAASIGLSALTFFPKMTPRPGPLFFCDLWPIFALGLSVALASRARVAAAGVGLAALVALAPVWTNELYHGFVPAAILAVATVALIASGRTLPRLAAFEWIGDFSYSLYLTHVPVFILAARWLVLPARSPVELFAGCAVTLALALGGAWLFCRWFEKPFHRVRRPVVRLASV